MVPRIPIQGSFALAFQNVLSFLDDLIIFDKCI